VVVHSTSQAPVVHCLLTRITLGQQCRSRSPGLCTAADRDGGGGGGAALESGADAGAAVGLVTITGGVREAPVVDVELVSVLTDVLDFMPTASFDGLRMTPAGVMGCCGAARNDAGGAP
jgi:hypothetical protein